MTIYTPDQYSDRSLFAAILKHFGPSLVSHVEEVTPQVENGNLALDLLLPVIVKYLNDEIEILQDEGRCPWYEQWARMPWSWQKDMAMDVVETMRALG